MADDAVKMWREMYSLINGVVPNTSLWKSEIPSGVTLLGSWNKPLVCNTAEGFWALIVNKPLIVTARLDWWLDFCKKPLGGGEGLSPEEIYRGMPISSAFASSALARRVGRHDVEVACGKNSRAHITFLALGTATAPGRKVRNHHLENVTKPCVLEGDGDNICPLPWVGVVGPRGWCRNRKSGEPQLFQFTTAVSFSWILAKVAGKNPPRNLEPFGHDLCDAIVKFEPGVAFYGFSPQDRADLRLFMEDPVNPELAKKLLPWIQGTGLAPSQGYTYIRYIDGSFAIYMHRSQGSSTDPTMICVWHASTRKSFMTSADDGLRSSSDPQRSWETATAICCQKLSGGQVMTVLKPTVPESYRIDSDENGVVTMTVGNSTVIPPTTPPSPTPNPPVNTGNSVKLTVLEPGKYLLTSNNERTTVREIHPDLVNGHKKRWIIEN